MRDRKKTGRFTSKKRSSSLPRLHSHEGITDHCYSKIPPPEQDVTNNPEHLWNQGRRIVELQVLAEGLAKCSKCPQPLELKNTVGETRFGLGSLLHIACRHCGQTTKVPTGKRHGSRRNKWDVNSKCALGMCNFTSGR